jgi:hypothetical protein
MVTSKLRLPFAARWGERVFQPGDYHIVLLAIEPVPVVAIHGGGVAAMLTPDRIDELDGTHLSTLFLKPGAPAPRVQILRLALAGLELHFQPNPPARTRKTGLLAIPVQEDGGSPWPLQ